MLIVIDCEQVCSHWVGGFQEMWSSGHFDFMQGVVCRARDYEGSRMQSATCPAVYFLLPSYNYTLYQEFHNREDCYGLLIILTACVIQSISLHHVTSTSRAHSVLWLVSVLICFYLVSLYLPRYFSHLDQCLISQYYTSPDYTSQFISFSFYTSPDSLTPNNFIG